MIRYSPLRVGGKRYSKNKFLQKTIALLILLLPCSIAAQSLLSKRINFELQETPISDALIELSEAADINIAFHPRLFSREETVSISMKDKTVKEILKSCLSATKITFKIEGEHLILFKKPTQYYTLSGYIEDAKTGERLIAATIWEANSGRGTTTNDYGFFSLKLPEGTIELQSSYLGYQGKLQTLSHTRSQKLTIALPPSITLQEIIVTDSEFEEQQKHINLGKGTSLPLQKMQTNIALVGESDILRYMNTLAGVQSGTDGFGGLQVRGGNSDQNLVLMDGVPIYNPSHTLGLFSIFNTQIVKNAQLLKGGFSAKYGGRLSSVMDIRVKEGNTKEWTGSGEIGTLATKLVIEGPLKKDKTGLLIAARRTHIDPIISNISERKKADKGEEGTINYHFADFNAKLHHRFSNKNQLFLSYYAGKDDFKDAYIYENEENFEEEDYYYYRYEDQEQKIDWGNQIIALRWNHLFNDRFFANTTFTYSKYDYSSSNNNLLYIEELEFIDIDDYYFTTFKSTIKDGGVKIDIEYYPTSRHQILFGGGFLARNFKSGIVDIYIDTASESDEEIETISSNETYELPSYDATELNFYIEDKVSLSDQLSILAGVHLATFFTDGKTYVLPQPRFSLIWNVSPKWRTYIAGSKMAQFLHILSTSGSGLPNDLWVPSTQAIRPQEAWQVEWTNTFQLHPNWAISFEAFYKKLSHLISYEDATTLPSLFEFDPDFWEEDSETGKGKSYGFSTTLERTKGSLTGQINYAYTVSTRQFTDTNENDPYPFRLNHPHELKLTAQYQLSKTASFNLNWQYGSGQPYSLLTTNSRFAPLNNLPRPEGTQTERIGPVNSHRLPAYHRLDMGFYFHWQRPTVAHHLTLGVYNLYNRKNPYYIYQYEDDYFPEDSGLQQQNGLPLLPSFSYRVVF